MKHEPRFPLRLDKLARGAKTPAPTPPAREVLRPQRPVHEAHRDAAQQGRPSGLGLDSAGVRRCLVQRLQGQGMRDEAVIAALLAVPRHAFVDAALVTQAYEDTSLPIGHGQTISKPSVVARMAELLRAGDSARRTGTLGRVLEVGTGCGYQAAVLARLATLVISIERVRPLHERARETLRAMRVDPVRLVYGDGMLGHPPNAPYDSVIAAAGGQALPQAWLDQMAIGGRLVCPLQRPGTREQVLVVVDRQVHGHVHSIHESVHFVPLKSGLDSR